MTLTLEQFRRAGCYERIVDLNHEANIFLTNLLVAEHEGKKHHQFRSERIMPAAESRDRLAEKFEIFIRECVK